MGSNIIWKVEAEDGLCCDNGGKEERPQEGVLRDRPSGCAPR